MGIKASETRAVFFENIIVPKENLIGELGKGFKIAMKVLNSGRLSLGSGCVGGMKSILELAVEHAKGRKQFNRSITEFGLIQIKLAQMASMIYATESTVYMTTGLMDRGMREYQLESAICKVFGSESLWSVVDTAMQVAAGCGYMQEYPYERMMRDSRINLIFEGTNEILRVFIALAGINGPGTFMKELGKVSDVSKFLKAPIKSLGVLSDFAVGRIQKIMSTSSLTKHHSSLSNEASILSSFLGDFGIVVENVLIKYGKNIIGNEYPQGRIADMAIHLYVMLALISRTTFILNKDGVSEDDKKYSQELFYHAFSRSKAIFEEKLKRDETK